MKKSDFGQVVLDDIDRELVRLLQHNGRMSTCEIARRLDCLGDRAVRYRIDRLEGEGLIHVSAVVCTRRLGWPLMGDVHVDIVPWKIAEAVRRLSADPRVCYIASSPDQNQISFQVNGRDRADLMAVVGDVVGALDGVTAMQVVPLTSLYRDVTRWQAPPDQDSA